MSVVRHKQGQIMWGKYQIRHRPTFFCSPLVKRVNRHHEVMSMAVSWDVYIWSRPVLVFAVATDRMTKWRTQIKTFTHISLSFHYISGRLTSSDWFPLKNKSFAFFNFSSSALALTLCAHHTHPHITYKYNTLQCSLSHGNTRWGGQNFTKPLMIKTEGQSFNKPFWNSCPSLWC